MILIDYVKVLNDIRAKQRTQDKIDAMFKAVELAAREQQDIKNKNGWYKLTPHKCPYCNSILIKRFGPGVVIQLNWSKDIKGYCTHCNKAILVNGESKPWNAEV
jgi:DNA-directed RNA polymerase subunit RPC12/RpoP